MNRIKLLQELGQSLWYDNIEKRLLNNGFLESLIRNEEIRGITSNPSIFQKAISTGIEYDDDITTMAWAGLEPQDILDKLIIKDIRLAADLFLPLYIQSNGKDGFVSIEVNPLLANSTEETVNEAARLWEVVDRPNAMIKIPATREGIPAIAQSIAAGINVNITLIFSLDRYGEVMDAFLTGLEQRIAQGLPIRDIASVASFFVSRVDTKVDAHLNQIIRREGDDAILAEKILGKSAIANANMAYSKFIEAFESERFRQLKEFGAQKQRPLWASTSTKNPAYRDVLYVEELVGKDTVNTVPPQTLDAVRDHAEIKVTLNRTDEAVQTLSSLEQLGISMEQVTRELEIEGVKAFADSYSALLQTVGIKAVDARAELSHLAKPVKRRIKTFEQNGTLRRIWERDASLWTSEIQGQVEIGQRLGWLNLPYQQPATLDGYLAIAKDCLSSGFENALLLGMGGSSLAPEVYQEMAAKHPELRSHDGLTLRVLDSTDPGQILRENAQNPIDKTLFIVSSKSGTTSEVDALLSYYWERTKEIYGPTAGDRFIAITDPGTPLETLAGEFHFRHIIPGETAVGGRFSALSAFRLIPAALLGFDLHKLLAGAAGMAELCAPNSHESINPGLVLGAVLGEAAVAGRDKLTILADPDLAAMGPWLEQLIAESSGKDGKGILPIEGEPELLPIEYSQDRIFVYLRSNGELSERAGKLRQAGFPVISINFSDPYSLGGEFFRWCFAIATASSIIGVNAFDQPDVQDNKTRTSEKLRAFEKGDSFIEEQAVQLDGDIQLFGWIPPGCETGMNLPKLIECFSKAAQSGDYIALNAYVPRSPESIRTLQELRKRILTISGVPVTLGFGPRFLHSTGQLHKGGSSRSLFVQITAAPKQDVPIPGRKITFGMLERAQALGDFESLQARGRRVMRIHLQDGDLTRLSG